MEHLICPVCETENGPDAAHCEVCGERLSAPEPGEVLAPEENVSAMLDEAPADETQDLDTFGSAAFEEEAFPAAAIEAVSSAIDEDIDVLYSPLDGTSYPAGSPEFEEGFGPMGEALVVNPPTNIHAEHAGQAEHTDAAYESEENFEHAENAHQAADTYSPEEPVSDELVEDSYIDSSGISGSPQFREMFKSEPKVREPSAPLPRPGIHTNPATLSVFVNREEAHRHYIETDETLLGRRDPHSDAYPDLDLSDYDQKALISRKHAYVYRQNKNYTLYVVSNSGTQLNNELLSLGDRRTLKADDVIVLAGIIAIKFELASS